LAIESRVDSAHTTTLKCESLPPGQDMHYVNRAPRAVKIGATLLEAEVPIVHLKRSVKGLLRL
jgi:hypothetical protein